jgi:protein-S-isoprenylcysteine O-methyltransferase Ste14
VRHPIYPTYIFLVCPAIVIAFASWPGLSIPFVAYGLYRLLIPREEARLEAVFDAHREYRRRVRGLVARVRRSSERTSRAMAA